ncbi:MAG: alpha/beta hydrolase [Bacteroidota bacterium]|nr:alpha/beta hydrolase [Bacteroidota bacterium]
MKSKFIYTLFVLACIAAQSCKSKKVSYGQNTEAGKYFDIRGIKMYYEIYGEGKPLLMLHGNGGSIKSFSNTIPYFASKYKVIAVDSRAQGKTIDSKDSLSFEMMADDVAALLDALHIDSAYVLGWSDGGINALLLAMRHPAIVIKLASSGANLWPDSTAFNPLAWLDSKAEYDSLNDLIPNTPKEKSDHKLFMLDWQQPHITLQALQSIQCPALIIAGDHDVISDEHTRLIAQSIPKSTLWIVPNSGHATLKEHKDEFNKKVDSFFSSR